MKKTLLSLAVLALMTQSGMVFAGGVNTPENFVDRNDFAIFKNNNSEQRHYELPVIRGFKKGTAKCTSYMGFVHKGDCGIGDAMVNGNLLKTNYVDYKTKGWFFKREIIVEAYGD